jgi:type IV secretory pathway VirB10-like protein
VNSNPATFTTNSAISKANLMAAGAKVRLAFIANGNKSASEEKPKQIKEKPEKVQQKPVKSNEKPEKVQQKPEKSNEKPAYISEKQVKKNEKTSNKKEKAPKKKTKADKQQETSTVIAPVEVIKQPVEVELTTAAEFMAGRPAHTGFPASAMGINWVSNIDANTAKFTAANKLVLLQDKAAYDAITTQEKLKEAFDNGNKTTDFTAKGGSLFKPQYFIVQDGEILRLIEMINIKFKAGESKAYFNERH